MRYFSSCLSFGNKTILKDKFNNKNCFCDVKLNFINPWLHYNKFKHLQVMFASKKSILIQFDMRKFLQH
jgi:hypothetical protein